MNQQELAIALFDAAYTGVQPDRLIRSCMSLAGSTLRAGEATVQLSGVERIFVVGGGKASGLMAKAVEEILGSRISSGAVVVKYGHACPCERIEILQAAHPYPDDAGVQATRRIVSLCASAGEKDLVLCLWSGGGSALLADYPEQCTLQQWIAFSKKLVNSGASIQEINAVRKHLSQVKGGQLARLAYPARVISLALSDVVGDPLDVIASGPTVADNSTFTDAARVLRQHGLTTETPECIVRHISRGAQGELPETPKARDPMLGRTQTFVIGRNRTALEAAAALARVHGYRSRIVTDRLDGDAQAAAHQIVKVALQTSQQSPGPLCLLFGGEPTLRVRGSGLGGRCQHLALLAAMKLRGIPNVTLLAGGTDGTDGPTDMAGAVVNGQTWEDAIVQGVSPESHLANFDSYHFFQRCGGHIHTGPTMTNVMDVVIVLVGG